MALSDLGLTSLPLQGLPVDLSVPMRPSSLTPHGTGFLLHFLPLTPGQLYSPAPPHCLYVRTHVHVYTAQVSGAQRTPQRSLLFPFTMKILRTGSRLSVLSGGVSAH